MGSNVNAGHREPWNKGKIVGQKAPFKLKDTGRFESACKWKAGCASLRSSTWESTAIGRP